MAAPVSAQPNQQILESVVHLYQSRLSPDNAVRTEAENRLTQMQTDMTNDLVFAVLALLKKHPEDQIRQQAALNIKQMLRESSMAELSSEGRQPANGVWQRLPDDLKKMVKAELIASMMSSEETSKVVRGAVCDTTSLLAAPTLSQDGWPELQQHIFGLLSSDDGLCQVSGLQLLSSLIGQLSKLLKEHAEEVRNFVSKLLMSPSVEVRNECVSLISSIVESEKRTVWRHFQTCVGSVLQALHLALQEPNDEHASRLLVSLIDIGEYNAAFYDKSLRDVANALFALARNTSLSDRTRQLSIEAAVTIAEGKPKMCRKAAGFVDDFLDVLMEVMVGIEDDPEWINNDKEDIDDDDDEQSNDDVAEAGLDRISATIGGDVILPKLQIIILRYLNDPHSTWQMKHAAMMAISQTVEHIPEDDNAVDVYLEQTIPLCLMNLRDPHPRVRFAAVQAIGQASTDTQPFIQEVYASSIMPALLAALDDPVVRIQSHAARALTNFCEELEPESLGIYLDTLVHKLLERVSTHAPRPLMSSCVTTLACIAPVADTLFVKYYPVVVPAMKEIVRTCVLPTYRTCRERALECITLVALAIGANAFSAETVECMDAITHLWTTAADGALQSVEASEKHLAPASSNTEGPSETINDSLCRMCRVLGADFATYLPHIMPRLFRIIAQKPSEMNVEDIAVYSKNVSLVSVSEGKTIGMKTYVALEIEQMTNLLYTVVSTLGTHFKEWIVHTVEACLPLLEFHFCDKVLQMSLSILAETFKVARSVANGETDETQRAQYYQMISTWLWTAIQKGFVAMEDETMMLENFMEVPKGIAAMIKAAGTFLLNAEQVSAVSKKTFELLESSCARDEEVTEGKNAEEHDEDDEDDLEGEQRFELEVAASVTEILSALMEHYPEYFLQAASDASVAFIKTQLATATARPEERSLCRTLALYVTVELIGMADRAHDLWLQFLPALLEALHSTDPIIRQPAAHGLKLALKHSNMLSAEAIVTIARSLLAALEKSNNLKKPLDDNDQGAADNIVSAIGALVFHQEKVIASTGDSMLAPDHLLRVWLANLPLKVDDQEGQLVHDTLVQLVLSENELVLGREMCNLPYLLTIFGDIYKTSHSTNEMDKKLLTIVRRYVPNLGNVASVMLDIQQQRHQQPMTKEQVKTVEKLLRDAQQENIVHTSA